MSKPQTKTEVLESDWRGLYKEKWGGQIVEQAVAHPAKFARALIRKIYDHAFEEGWLKVGDQVIDPFGGVALGALDAIQRGLCWTGVELEPRFVGLGNQNIALWTDYYTSRLPCCGSARLVQGDSRQLAGVIAQAQAAMISSPPFGEALRGGGISAAKRGDGDYRITTNKPGACYQPSEQGVSDGNLAAMRATDADHAAIISSPPYEGYDDHGGRRTAAERDRRRLERLRPDLIGRFDTCFKGSEEYGEAPGQLGNERGDTFWAASRTILEQCFSVLPSGGHAIWVLKDFVRKGRRVEFCAQWAELCEAVGFRLLHIHRSWLVEKHGHQQTFTGEDQAIETQRKSFFRRLAERKGSPAIDYETVICLVKP